MSQFLIQGTNQSKLPINRWSSSVTWWASNYHLLSCRWNRWAIATSRGKSGSVLPKGVLLNPSALVTDLTYASLWSLRGGNFPWSEAAITTWILKPTLQTYQDLTADPTSKSIKCYHWFSYKSWDDCDQSIKNYLSVKKSFHNGKRNELSKTMHYFIALWKGLAGQLQVSKSSGNAHNVWPWLLQLDFSYDLCNATKAPIVSTIVLLACAIV